MLTIFTIPKAFEGHINIIQRNAIKSWTLLKPKPEIILFGNEKDTESVAHEFGIRHIPEIKCNDYGTPFLDSVFKQAQELANHETLCYVNADIILMKDFMRAVGRIPFDDFLMVGRRWDINIKEKPDWQKQSIRYVIKHGKLATYDNIDYFIFPRKSRLAIMPPFLVGRPCWDNWLVYRAVELGIPIINASKSVMAIHQDHEHSPNVHSKEEGRWIGPESDWNRSLTGGNMLFINHANYIMFAGFVMPLRIYRFLVGIYNLVFKGKMIKP